MGRGEGVAVVVGAVIWWLELLPWVLGSFTLGMMVGGCLRWHIIWMDLWKHRKRR